MNNVRMARPLFAVILGLVALLQQPLAAQSEPPFEPRVEFGVNGVLLAGLLVLDFIGDPQSRVAGPAVSVRLNMAERFALEVGGIFAGVDDVTVHYYEASVVIKQRAHQRERWFRFIRVGAGGHHEFIRVGEFRNDNQDHTTTVFPAYDHHKLTAPNFFLAGAGIERVVSSRLAIAAELGGVVGAIGYGLRASAGVVVPLGSYHAR
jgi:hypothetical protein